VKVKKRKKIHELFFSFLILLIPLQLGKHFWPNWSYVLGLRIDYLSPTVYLTDLLVLGLLGSWALEIRHTRYAIRDRLKRHWWLVVFFLFLLVNCFLAQNKAVAFYKLLKVAEFSFLGFYIAQTKIKLSFIAYHLSLATIYSSLIALGQFVKQTSFGGFFWWLGERTFDAGTPGIAKAIVGGRLVMRPYATFPHPNVLAGFVLISLVLTFPLLFQKRKFFAISCLLLAFGVLAISFSRAVWLVGLGIGIWFLLRRFQAQKKLFFVICCFLLIVLLLAHRSPALRAVRFSEVGFVLKLPFSTNEAIDQRVDLIKASVLMLKNNPFAGVGLNNFIVRLPDFWQLPETVHLLQPVHNIFLLVAAETGFVGLAVFLWFLFLTFRNLLRTKDQQLLLSLSAILALGLFDHYWLTLQQAQLLLTILFGLSWRG
jgi:O-antigen ligase